MATITLTVEVTDTEQAILLNNLVDIDAWLQGAMDGKKNNCWKRMQQEWTSSQSSSLTNSSYSFNISSSSQDGK